MDLRYTRFKFIYMDSGKHATRVIGGVFNTLGASRLQGGGGLEEGGAGRLQGLWIYRVWALKWASECLRKRYACRQMRGKSNQTRTTVA